MSDKLLKDNRTFIQFAVKRSIGAIKEPPLGVTISQLLDKLAMDYDVVMKELSAE